jgi:DNA polymerase-3 subunit beta
MENHTMQSTINIKALKAIAFAASTEETRYYLNGVFVQIAKDHTTYVATDGHILLAHREDAPKDQPNEMLGDFIIPNETIKAFKLHKRIDLATVTREGDKNPAVLRIDYIDHTSITKTIDGTFPDWRRVVPTNPSGKPGHYNPELLCKLQKAARTLTGDNTGGTPMLAQDDSGPTLVSFIGLEDTFGVIMPMRGETPKLPAWFMEGEPKPIETPAEPESIEDSAPCSEPIAAE